MWMRCRLNIREFLLPLCSLTWDDGLTTLSRPFALEIEQPEIGVLKACRELGCAVVCYSPIGRGMLGGTIRSPDDFEEGDFRKYAPRFSKENFPKNLELVDKIQAIANKKGVTPSQLTLAWILAQGDDFFPVCVVTQADARLLLLTIVLRFLVRPISSVLRRIWAL